MSSSPIAKRARTDVREASLHGAAMKAVCDPAELRAVGKAFNDAWQQVSTHVSTRADQVDAARLTLFEVLLNLTKDGTCDCAKLTEDATSKMLEGPATRG
jgi:hypothetical protein